jgi:hypothetical protein
MGGVVTVDALMIKPVYAMKEGTESTFDDAREALYCSNVSAVALGSETGCGVGRASMPEQLAAKGGLPRTGVRASM